MRGLGHEIQQDEVLRLLQLPWSRANAELLLPAHLDKRHSKSSDVVPNFLARSRCPRYSSDASCGASLAPAATLKGFAVHLQKRGRKQVPQGRRPPQRQGLPARRSSLLHILTFLTAKIQIELQAAVWLEGMANKQEVGGLPKKVRYKFRAKSHRVPRRHI